MKLQFKSSSVFDQAGTKLLFAEQRTKSLAAMEAIVGLLLQSKPAT